jgi:hypothetical protein
MKTFDSSDDLQGARFYGANLRGARFVESDLSGVVIRGSEVARLDIDAPWLPHGDYLRVNGIDVTPFVEAELDRRFPGRELRRAEDPAGLQAAYAAVERTWAVTLERARSMPEGAVDESVDGEWSFAQTLRHLVHATDVWLHRGVFQVERSHPLGIGYVDPSAPSAVDPDVRPTYDEVLAARSERVAMMRDFIATVTPDVLDEARPNPHDPGHAETVRSCLHVIIEEEWEHHRFAVRDLDAIAAASESGSLEGQP